MENLVIEILSARRCVFSGPRALAIEGARDAINESGGKIIDPSGSDGFIEGKFRYGINPFGLRVRCEFQDYSNSKILIETHGHFVDAFDVTGKAQQKAEELLKKFIAIMINKHNAEVDYQSSAINSPTEAVETLRCEAPSFDNDGGWYYTAAGERKGPVSQQAIRQMLERKELNPDSTQVWRKGMGEWASLRNSDLGKFAASEPPPIAGDQINNSIVWVVAVLPLVFGFIDAYLATRPEVVFARRLSMIPGSGVAFHESELPWALTTAINSILCLWDERRLNKAGHSKKWMTISAILLVPVYLFLRAKQLKQRPIYAITWIALLVISILLVSSAQS